MCVSLCPSLSRALARGASVVGGGERVWGGGELREKKEEVELSRLLASLSSSLSHSPWLSLFSQLSKQITMALSAAVTFRPAALARAGRATISVPRVARRTVAVRAASRDQVRATFESFDKVASFVLRPREKKATTMTKGIPIVSPPRFWASTGRACSSRASLSARIF